MAFNLKSFLRRTPLTVLRWYFEMRKISLSDRVEWEDATQTRPDALCEAIGALSQQDRDTIITDFERIEPLCNPPGRRALYSVAAADPRVLSLLQTVESDEARGIVLLIESRVLFDYALAAAYAERLRNGRSWSAFNVADAAAISSAPPDLAALKTELLAILRRSDGSIGKLKIESFERSAVLEDGKGAGLTVHYAIYREDLPVSDDQFHGDELAHETRRPVDKGAIVYDADGKTLDIIAGGGKEVRSRIAESFAQNILSVKQKIRPVAPRRFTLDRLRQPLPFETDPEHGIKTVKVTLLGLARLGSRYERVTIEVDPSDRIDICARSQQWFGDRDPLRQPEWQVEHATLRIVFHPESSGARDRVVSIGLHASNKWNLRDQTRRHQIISQNYLARWGLIAMSGS